MKWYFFSENKEGISEWWVRGTIKVFYDFFMNRFKLELSILFHNNVAVIVDDIVFGEDFVYLRFCTLSKPLLIFHYYHCKLVFSSPLSDALVPDVVDWWHMVSFYTENHTGCRLLGSLFNQLMGSNISDLKNPQITISRLMYILFSHL